MVEKTIQPIMLSIYVYFLTIAEEYFTSDFKRSDHNKAICIAFPVVLAERTVPTKVLTEIRQMAECAPSSLKHLVLM